MSKFVYCLELEGGYYYVGMASDPQVRLLQHLGRSSAWTTAHRPIRFVTQPVGPLTKLQAASMEESTTLEMMHKHGVPNVRGAQWAQISLSAEDFKAACHRSITCLGCGFRGHTLSTCPGAAVAMTPRISAALRTQHTHISALPPSPSPINPVQHELASAVPASQNPTPLPISAAPVPFSTAEHLSPVPAIARSTSGPQRKRSRELDEGSAGVCCSRESHWADGCYAHTHTVGTNRVTPAALGPMAAAEPLRTASAPAPSASEPQSGPSSERHRGSACVRCGHRSHWVARCYARTHANGTTLSIPAAALAPIAAAEPPRAAPAPALSTSTPQSERQRDSAALQIQQTQGQAVPSSPPSPSLTISVRRELQQELASTVPASQDPTAPPISAAPASIAAAVPLSPASAPARSASGPQSGRSSERHDGSACVRCGYGSHGVARCYARTHANGTKLTTPAGLGPIAQVEPLRTAQAPARSTSGPLSERSRESNEGGACARLGSVSHMDVD